MSSTNDLTTKIIAYFFSLRIFAYRQNVLPIPISRQGQIIGYRPPATTGLPDIQAIIPRGFSSRWPCGSGYVGIEVKNSVTKDSLRESQRSFHANARAGGDAVILVVRSYDDFLSQLKPIFDLYDGTKNIPNAT
jgi:hypothetical protein